MPAFTFEKIPAPARATASAMAHAAPRKAGAGKPRKLIHAMLDRLAIARLKRDEAKLPPAVPRKPPPE